MSNVSIGEVIRIYMKLREQKTAIEAEVKEKVSTIKEKMEKIEAFLLDQMDKQGLSSFKSEYGTAYLTTVDFASVSDWNALTEFVHKNNAYDLFEKRVCKSAVRDYIKTTKNVPPGVNYGTKLNVSIRKPTVKDID